MVNLSAERYPALDALRGFAALTIVLYHFQTNSPLTANAFVAQGALMVDFFFVLSGFVISLNYCDRIRSARDLWWFQKKRFWRLYPLHLVTFLAFVGIETFQFYRGQTTAFVTNDLEAALHNLFLTQAVLTNHTSFNMPSWSISAEFWTYLIFGIALLFGRYRWPLLIACWLIAGTVIYLQSTSVLAPNVAGILLGRALYGFAIGVLVHQIQSRQKRREFGSLTLLFFMGMAVWLIAHFTIHLLLVTPLIFAAVVYTVAWSGPKTWVQRFLISPVPAFLGRISYSIYMTHAILTFWFFYFVLEHPPFSPSESTLVTSLLIACVIGLSTLTYRFIEQPFKAGLDIRAAGTQTLPPRLAE